ncbi:MAG: histidine phosphatase family protein [Candidatus Rokubacteria bacterium]|nr:histidine phosphatase family protein [Candidatus Rokubacteria bacterium]
MVLERSWQALRDLARLHCGQHVVVVTHGGVIQIALTRANGLPVTRYRTFPVANASQTVLGFRSDGSVAVLPGW